MKSLAKVTLPLKHSVKLLGCKLCGDVAACREVAYVPFVVLTAVCTTKSTYAVSKTETCRSDNYMHFNINLNFSKFNKNGICS